MLRFYFNADKLNGAADNLMMRYACIAAGAEGGGEFYAEKILKLIAVKDVLAEFWSYLNGVVGKIPPADVEILRRYCLMRTGISRLPDNSRKEIKKALIKFTRRARFAERFAQAEEVINEFYSLI